MTPLTDAHVGPPSGPVPGNSVSMRADRVLDA